MIKLFTEKMNYFLGGDMTTTEKGNSGVLHQIDILLTTGEKLVLVECKNHQKKIGYDVVAKKSVGIRSKELIRRLFSYCSLQTMRKPTLSYLYRGE